jgi:AcrR family transcriptional regulator
MKGPDRRKQILAIARELVASEGMEALTMTALADRARIAKPVVYIHFANRDQVAIALLDEHFTDMSRFVRKRIAKARTIDEYLSLVIDGAFDFEESSSIPVRRITNGFSAGDDVNQAFHRYEEKFRQQWRRLLELQDIPKNTAEAAAYGLMSMMNNVVFNFAGTSKRRHARAVTKKMMLDAVHGLLGGPKNAEKFKIIVDFDIINSPE